MASLDNSYEEVFPTICEFRQYKSLEATSNNDNKTPTASSVEQVSKAWNVTLKMKSIFNTTLFLSPSRELLKVVVCDYTSCSNHQMVAILE